MLLLLVFVLISPSCLPPVLLPPPLVAILPFLPRLVAIGLPLKNSLAIPLPLPAALFLLLAAVFLGGYSLAEDDKHSNSYSDSISVLLSQ